MGKLYQHFTDRIPGFLFSIGLMHKRITDIVMEGDGSYRTNSGTSGNQTEVCVRPAMWVTI